MSTCEMCMAEGEGFVTDRDGNDFCPKCYGDLLAALRERIAKLPKRIGLCPEHAEEFYYPLSDDESLSCPQCPLEMIVYERVESD